MPAFPTRHAAWVGSRNFSDTLGSKPGRAKSKRLWQGALRAAAVEILVWLYAYLVIYDLFYLGHKSNVRPLRRLLASMRCPEQASSANKSPHEIKGYLPSAKSQRLPSVSQRQMRGLIWERRRWVGLSHTPGQPPPSIPASTRPHHGERHWTGSSVAVRRRLCLRGTDTRGAFPVH